MRPEPESSPTWHEVQRWNADDRYMWEERVAIMMENCGHSLEQAELAAYEDCIKWRWGGIHHGK